jgi:hypothetical protein
MSFLNTNYSATIAARLTQKGRNAISKGNFNISYFAIGDSEYNYSGTSTQSILAPFDKDLNVKYPLWYTSGSTYFGVPIESSITTTCKNVMDSNTGTGWTLSTVWEKIPIGLTGTTSSKYMGTKSFLGYTTSSGQTYNTGTTISPEEQKAIAILHYSYSGSTNNLNDFFKYDDYISTSTGVTSGSNGKTDREYFEVTIPTLMYDKLSGATTGATFTMSTGDTKTMVSNFNGRFTIDYKDLVDYTGNTVGKIFHNHKIVVFDDEEIVAALDNGSNRKYTLAPPKVDTIVTNNQPITGLTPDTTLWITYNFINTGTTFDDLPCTKFVKVTGSTNNENVTVKFDAGGFKHLNSGYTASQIFILHQLTNNGAQPISDQWKARNYTDELIDPPSGSINDLKTGFTFTINQTKYDEAIPYTSSLSNFGSETAYPGNVKLVRASDIEEMVFNLSLPNDKFVTSQNPTYPTIGTPPPPKYITEVALLNSNKEALVMGKLSEPIERKGAQVFSVKLDF